MVATLCLAVAACAAKRKIEIASDHDPDARFAAYRYYAWTTPPAKASLDYPVSDTASRDWRIRGAIDRALAARGFRLGAQPDFLVVYDVRTTAQQTSSFTEWFDYRARGGDKGLGDAFFGYDEGTLLVGVVDARTRRLVWRAWATAVLSGTAFTDAEVDQTVTRLFASFPPS